MALGPKYYLEEAQYRVERTVRKIQGKTMQFGLRAAMGGGAAAVATKFSGPFRESIGLDPLHSLSVSTTEAITSATGGLLTAGIGVGINAYMNHLEYKHEESRLCELYRPQIASILGKERDGVGVKDLYDVAETNPSLQDALDRNRTGRNVKNAGAAAGTVVAFAVVFAAIALVPPLGVLAGAAAAGGLFSGAGLAFAGIAGAIGYGTLQGVRRGACKLGKKLFGLDKPSVEDQVGDLSKMHRKEQIIMPEHVLGVYAAAQPGLATEIETQFGKPFHKLDITGKREAVARFGERLDLFNTTQAINDGHMNVRELTFRVHGQVSGVYPEPSFGDRLREAAHEKLDPLGDKLGNLREGAVGRFQDWRENRRQSKLQDKVEEALEEGRPLPKEALEAAPESTWSDRIRQEQLVAQTEQSPAR